MKRLILLSIVSIAAMSAHADPHNVYGVWMPPAETSHIEISDCGDGTPCGTVVWLDAEALLPGVTPGTAVDANGDNVISKSEASMRLRAEFDQADCDRSRTLDATEIRRYFRDGKPCG